MFLRFSEVLVLWFYHSFINKTKIGGCEGFVTGELYDAYIAEGVADIMNVTLVPCKLLL